MIVFVFVLMGLASYRVTRFLTQDSFPPVAHARAWLINRWSATTKDQEWAELLTCPYCAGWWISGLVLATARALGLLPIRRALVFALWLPLAGAQALLNAIDSRIS